MMNSVPQGNWRPVTLIGVSILVHSFAMLGFILEPVIWPWLLSAVFLDHLLMAVLGLLPRHGWLGSNLISLPGAAVARNEIALTIDDGPDPEVTPQVLDILDEYRVKATFFCIGRQAARFPALCKEIVERGHSIENHTQHHRHTFSLLGKSGYLREIQAAQETLEQITGSAPCFFRAPAGFRNIFLSVALRVLQLQLVSWSVRGYDAYLRDESRIKAKLLKGLRPGAILLLHDGNAARTMDSQPVIVAVLPALLSAAQSAGLHYVTLRQACIHLQMPEPQNQSLNGQPA